ncbi:MAG: hypothetical protein AAF634_05765 [Bacteroidota bacterium]
MELAYFQNICQTLCDNYAEVTEGKMMRSPAIHYRGKVFAFLSRKQKLVIKLGKFFPLDTLEVKVCEFNPFTTKSALPGWYEVDFGVKDAWPSMAKLAYTLAKNGGS